MGIKRAYKTVPDLTRSVQETLIRPALENTYDRLFEKLQEYIEEDIYNNAKIYSEGEGEWYAQEVGQSREMLQAFEWNVYKYAGEYKGKIEFQPNAITHDGWQHGNPLRELAPTTFLKILNNETPQGDCCNFPFVDRRPFWDDFVEYANKHLQDIFNEEVLKLGGTLTKKRYVARKSS